MSSAAVGPAPRQRSTTIRGAKVLAHSIRTEPRIFAGALVGSALYGTMTVAAAWAVGWATGHVVLPDFADGHVDSGTLATAGLLIVGVAVAKVVGIFGRRLLAGVMQFRMQARYRHRVTEAYLRLPLSWHQRFPTGQLLSNANSDIEMSFMTIAPMPMSLGVVIMLLMAIVDMFLTDTTLAWVGVALFPLVIAVNTIYVRHSGPRFARAQQLRATVAEVAHESFDGALVVKTLGRADAEADRFAARAYALRDANIAAGRVRSLFDPVLEALPNLGVLAVLLLGAIQAAQDHTQAGNVVNIAYLITLLAFPIRAIGWVLGDMPRSVVGFERVMNVLTAQDRTDYGAQRLTRDGPARLDLADVHFAYPAPAYPAAADQDPAPAAGSGRVDLAAGFAAGPGTATAANGANAAADTAPEVLRGVSAAITPGSTVALVGVTGSGKSTLAALLARLGDPGSGRITLDGADLRDLAKGEVSRTVALVPQQTFIFGDTVRANVDLAGRRGAEEIWAALRVAQAETFVKALPDGLDTVIGERGATLSGGQRQRLALARALVNRPRLLVLDDCTSAVDPSVEAAILAGLKETDLAATVLVIAYRRATVALADEVLFLAGGRIEDRGRHEDLVGRSDGYRDLITAYARAAETGGDAR
ncbi:MAG TPA: ABC transporter ATP-binding protein [Actinocrinis sp.]|nr:ABC transporter ATP-binding protein [Actinocrinis sp.]